MIHLRLLGGLSLAADDEPVSGRAAQRHRLALLALLGASQSDPVGRERLADLLWPEAGPRSRHLLSNSVHIIRKTLGDDAIRGTADALWLNTERIRCDVRAFEAAIADGDPVRAVELYRGPFLDGFFLAGTPGFEAWVDGERERLARAYAQALEGLATEREAAGDYRAATEWWRRLVAADPPAGRAVLRLMRALEAADEVEQAIRCARAYESLVRTELDLEPDRAVVLFAERLARERSWHVEGGDHTVAAASGAAHGPVPGPTAGPAVGSGESATGLGRTRTRTRRVAPYGLAALLAGFGIAGVLRATSDRTSAGGACGGIGQHTDLRPTPNIAAYELYRTATDPVMRRTEGSLQSAVQQLERSVELDPGFAASWAELSRLYLANTRAQPPGADRRELRQKAEQAALRALALDESLPEAHWALGSVRYHGLDLEAAEPELRCAVELDSADFRYRLILTNTYIVLGRFDDALRQARAALALAPLSASVQTNFARVLVADGRCDEALARLERLADLEPPLRDAATLAAQCYARKGMWPEAIEWLERFAPDRLDHGDALLGYVYARAGMESRALEIHERLLKDWWEGGGNAEAIALSSVGLGRLDAALLWLHRSIDEGTLLVIEIMQPAYEDLRRHPDFERVARRIGLQKW